MGDEQNRSGLAKTFNLIWPIIRTAFRNVNIRFDGEARKVILTHKEKIEEIRFDDIEEAVNKNRL